MKYPRTEHIETPEDGIVEATKSGPENYWEINHPWGMKKYYGTLTGVKTQVKQIVKDHTV